MDDIPDKQFAQFFTFFPVLCLRLLLWTLHFFIASAKTEREQKPTVPMVAKPTDSEKATTQMKQERKSLSRKQNNNENMLK